MYDVSTIWKCDNQHEKYHKLCSNVYSLTHQQLDPTIGTNSEAAPAAKSKHYSMLFSPVSLKCHTCNTFPWNQFMFWNHKSVVSNWAYWRKLYCFTRLSFSCIKIHCNNTTQSLRLQIGNHSFSSTWLFWTDNSCIFSSTMDTIPGFHVLTCQPAANLPSIHGAIWSTCLLFVPPFIQLQET